MGEHGAGPRCESGLLNRLKVPQGEVGLRFDRILFELGVFVVTCSRTFHSLGPK